MTELEIEQTIISKRLTAPRLLPSDIDNVIKYKEFWVVPNTSTTVCALILQNNYVVIGKSAAASLANFDEELGKSIAFDNAREQIWGLEGYLLKDKLFYGY
ncbi:MAG: Gp49 family protein [Sulfuricurvum sp.]